MNVAHTHTGRTSGLAQWHKSRPKNPKLNNQRRIERTAKPNGTHTQKNGDCARAFSGPFLALYHIRRWFAARAPFLHGSPAMPAESTAYFPLSCVCVCARRENEMLLFIRVQWLPVCVCVCCAPVVFCYCKRFSVRCVVVVVFCVCL